MVENLAIIFIFTFRFVKFCAGIKSLHILKNKVKLQMFELQNSQPFFHIF